MNDKRCGRAASDCNSIASNDPSELSYHAQYYRLSTAEAEKFIKEARRNRERANEMAVSLLLSTVRNSYCSQRA
jgi:hypothetical protein